MFLNLSSIRSSSSRLSSVRSYRMEVESRELTTQGEFLFGMVTNSTSVGGFKRITGKYVELDDGEFEVTLIRRPASPMELNLIMAALINRNINTDCMYCFKTSSLRIRSDEPVAWTLDGEFGGEHTVVEICNQKQALCIKIPE